MLMIGCSDLSARKRKTEEITRQVGAFLKKHLQLELSKTKTLITHGRTEKAKFLGYEISTFQRNDARERDVLQTAEFLNGKVELGLPASVIQEKCQRYMAHNKPIHRTEMLNDCGFLHHDALSRRVSGNCRVLSSRPQSLRLELKWIMEQSLVKTLAAKLKLSVPKVYERFQAILLTNGKPYKGLQTIIQREGKKPLVAQWGGIPLQRRMDTPLNDAPYLYWNGRTEIVQRLLADTCELCGSHTAIEVHHIRALKDLKQYGRPEKPIWVKTMAARHRKTLVVCRSCHKDIHYGRSLKQHHQLE